MKRSARAFYAAVASGIFLVEIAIAAGVVAGPFVRGSVGDILAVALIYFVLRVLLVSPVKAAVTAVAVGFAIEALQFFHVADWLGLDRGGIPYLLIGNTYSPVDLIMYAVGGGGALSIDRYLLGPRLASATA